jgi:sugar lactone lactonase YvrE
MKTEVAIVARDRHDELGEGTFWSVREQALYWVDILGKRVNRLNAGGKVESWEVGDHVGWVIEREKGGLVAGLGRRFVGLTLSPVAIETIADPEPALDGNRMNDAKADRFGRIWAGTMPLTADQPTGSFYRLDPDGAAARVDGPYTIPNGPAIASDGSFMFHTDTALDTIFRIDIHDDGSLGPRQPFVLFERDWGHPDGMTLDAEGGLWVACWGGSRVIRFAPDGKVDRMIALPASQISNCAFGGAQLDRLFLSSAAVGVDEPQAGSLFEIDPGTRGLAPFLYRG